jgi:hypothetical protein
MALTPNPSPAMRERGWGEGSPLLARQLVLEDLRPIDDPQLAA